MKDFEGVKFGEDGKIKDDYLYYAINRYVGAFIAVNWTPYLSQMDDIKHDIFIKFKRADSYDASKGAVSTYLCRIARNHIISIYNKKRRQMKGGQIELDREGTFADYVLPGVEQEEDKVYTSRDEGLLQDIMEDAFKGLSELEYSVINDKFIKGMRDIDSYTEKGIMKRRFYRIVNRSKDKIYVQIRKSGYAKELAGMIGQKLI